MTITATEACEAMLPHLRMLSEELAARADAVPGALLAASPGPQAKGLGR